MKFEDLPILFDIRETKPGGWSRTGKREGTIAELLETWDIDNPYEDSEMAQVLRLLKTAMEE